MSRCLACYRPLKPGELNFHAACSLAFFGTKQPPTLPYTLATMHQLAEQIVRHVRQQISVTGVQPKQSLGLATTAGQSRLTLERVGEMQKAGSQVNFVATKQQKHDFSVATTDRLPVGSNFAFFRSETQT